MTDARAVLRRMQWESTHPPVHTQGISEAALLRAAAEVGRLQTADPSEFSFGKASGQAREFVRLLSALVPEHVPDDRIHFEVAQIISNPLVSAATVLDILNGGTTGEPIIGWTPPGTVRKAGRMLRDGRMRGEVIRELGVSRRLTQMLAEFLGVDEARREHLRDLAEEWLQEGRWDVMDFARSVGIGEWQARRILTSVADGLGIHGGSQR